ncbi:MAG: IS3 family transposase [bacterium]
MTEKSRTESTVREIRRKTRKKYSAEEKIRIILEGFRGEDSIAELCRREGIHANLYYKWSKEFLEAGKQRLLGDTKRQASTPEVADLRRENAQLKELVADLSLKNVVLKKSLVGFGSGRVMRYSQSEKKEIIRLVEESDLSVKQTLEELDVPKSTFYRWYRRYNEYGYDGLTSRPPNANRFWNRIPDHEKDKVVEVALDYPELSPRELAWKITDSEGTFISESSVYRILKSYDLVTSPSYIVMVATDEFRNKTRRVHELWQTDFTYLKVIGWGWYYLSTILDDYSRYIIAWKLFTTMSSDDVIRTLDLAVDATGINQPTVKHKPRLLSDNGPCYLAGDLQNYLDDREMDHTRGQPYHPMTQGKIERWHRTMKNTIKLQNYYFPGELEQEIAAFIDHYNHQRVHESLDNLTPADVYHGRAKEILTLRNELKEQTLRRRRRENLGLPPLKTELIRPQVLRESAS